MEEYFFSRKLREVQKLREEGLDVINLAIGSPDLPPHPDVIDALKESAKLPHVHGYQSYQGIPELRKAFADFYGRHYGVGLDAQLEILPLMGSKEGITHVSMAFLDAGDQVLIPDPGYPTYSSVSKLIGVKTIPYRLNPFDNWAPDFEEIASHDLTKVKLMWVNYPHMPTGAKANLQVFQKIIDFGLKHGILIVHDNPYSFILEDQPKSIFQIPGSKSIALELNSLSKTANMAGWRIGMVAGRQEWVEAITKVKSQMDSGMFFGLQQGAIAALNMDANWYASLNQHYESRRQYAWELADALGLEYFRETAGMFVWAKIPFQKTAEEMVDELLFQHGIFVTPGSVFGQRGQGHIRISLCAPEAHFEKAIHRVS